VLSLNGILYSTCRHLYNLLVMSMMFLITCVPIITIPAGIAAMCGVCRGLLHDDDFGVCGPFWHFFRENFVQSTVCGWTIVLCSVFLWLDASWAQDLTGFIRLPILLIIGLLDLTLISVSAHIFPLMVHMRSTYRHLFISSLKLSLYRSHLTVANLSSILVVYIIADHFPLTLFLLLPGVTAWITLWFVDKKITSIQMIQESAR